MPTNRAQKRELLLNAAVNIYALNGDVTARELAQATSMNVASLNYYFGSKEILVDEIEQRLLTVFVSELVDIGERDISPAERLTDLMFTVSDRLVRSPGIARHFVQMLLSGSPRVYDLMEQSVGDGSPIHRIFCDILKETGFEDQQEIWHRLVISICSLAPVLAISCDKLDLDVSQMSLRNNPFMSNHIRSLVNMLLSNSNI